MQKVTSILSSTFIILWGACIFGSLSVLPYLIVLSGTQFNFAKILSYLIQNSIIYAIACAGGLYFSQKVGFKLNFHTKKRSKHLREYGLAVLYGLLIGSLIVFLKTIILHSGAINPPWYLGLLASFYGAINEEVVTRLFLLSMIVWGLDKIFKLKSELLYWIGIIVVALLFGIGHLPLAFQIIDVTIFSIVGILLLNSIAGIFFGYLYWCYNLEIAMLAHFFADLVLHVFAPMFLK